jgi:hypothetical protein
MHIVGEVRIVPQAMSQLWEELTRIVRDDEQGSVSV